MSLLEFFSMYKTVPDKARQALCHSWVRFVWKKFIMKEASSFLIGEQKGFRF